MNKSHKLASSEVKCIKCHKPDPSNINVYVRPVIIKQQITSKIFTALVTESPLVKRTKLGEVVSNITITAGVAFPSKSASTCAGVKVGFLDNMSETAPII